MELHERDPAPGDLWLVQEFVNTLDIEQSRDDLASPDLLAAWLENHGLMAAGGVVAEADRRRVIEVREVLRALLLAHNGAEFDPQAAAILNRAAVAAPLHIRVFSDGGVDLVASEFGVQGAIGRILATVFTAVTAGTWPRLKACRDDACRWAFYDRSKNRSGAWCSMADCGNRTKTRAYRERRRATVRSPEG